MPELPEVEVVKKSLKKNIHQLILKNVEIRNKFLRYRIDEKMIKKLIKSKVLSVTRRSKYILIKFNNNFTLLIHLGMTGKIIIIDTKKAVRNSSFYFKLINHKSKHDHLFFEFNNNVKIIYNDVRKFGFIKVEKTNKLLVNKHLTKLGPEPLSRKFNLKYFKTIVNKKKIMLKDLLMDQKFVSGLGNIYVNEAIFLSRIHPKIKAKKLSKKRLICLITNIKNVLKKAIKEGGSSIKDFNNTDGKEGNFQQFFYVYGREDEACRRPKCSGKIKRIRLSNRSTFFCDLCQKY